MSILNKKEEVISIELTPLGKEQLSRGVFNPVYYSFFDDEVIYKLSESEDQNDIENRILNQSIVFKPVVRTDSVENSSKHLVELKPSVEERESNIYFLNTSKNKSIQPIGSNDLSKNYTPAWDLKVLEGNLESTIIDITPSLSCSDISFITKFNAPSIDNKTNNIQISDELIVSIEENFLLLEINEKNTYDKTQNFDIELYEIIDSTSDKEVERKLFFLTKPETIKDGVMLDESEIPLDNSEKDITNHHVQYFFDLLVDNEIDATFIEQTATEQMKNIYSTTVEGPFEKEC